MTMKVELEADHIRFLINCLSNLKVKVKDAIYIVDIIRRLQIALNKENKEETKND